METATRIGIGSPLEAVPVRGARQQRGDGDGHGRRLLHLRQPRHPGAAGARHPDHPGRRHRAVQPRAPPDQGARRRARRHPHRASSSRRSSAARAPGPSSIARWPARRARPTTTRTPGSPGTPPSWPRRCGSGSPSSAPTTSSCRWSRRTRRSRSPAARTRRRSGSSFMSAALAGRPVVEFHAPTTTTTVAAVRAAAAAGASARSSTVPDVTGLHGRRGARHPARTPGSRSPPVPAAQVQRAEGHRGRAVTRRRARRRGAPPSRSRSPLN